MTVTVSADQPAELAVQQELVVAPSATHPVATNWPNSHYSCNRYTNMVVYHPNTQSSVYIPRNQHIPYSQHGRTPHYIAIQHAPIPYMVYVYMCIGVQLCVNHIYTPIHIYTYKWVSKYNTLCSCMWAVGNLNLGYAFICTQSTNGKTQAIQLWYSHSRFHLGHHLICCPD